jgi:predicted nucleotidyltransferase
MTVDGTATESLDVYRATLRARSDRDARARAARRRRARLVAQTAAEALVREFGATRVTLFGSLAHGHWFSDASDIDLVAWGLGAEAHLLALARLEDLAGGFRVDLIRAERCPASLLAAIEADGVAP